MISETAPFRIGNLDAKIICKDGDFTSLENILGEALQLYKLELYAYQMTELMGTESCYLKLFKYAMMSRISRAVRALNP